MGSTSSPADPDGGTGLDRASASLARFRDHQDAGDNVPLALENLCRAAAAALSLTAVVVRLIPSEDPGVVIAGSASGQELGALEALCGEGPGRTAHLDRRSIFVADLARDGPARWPGYAAAALDAGVAAVFVIPLSVGAARLGTLEGFGAQAGSLPQTATDMALGFAQLATDFLTSPPTERTKPGIDEEIGRALDHRAEIAQAQGMVTVDLGVDLMEALMLLRAHAFAENKTLLELAREIKEGYRLPNDLIPDLPGGSEKKEGQDD